MTEKIKRLITKSGHNDMATACSSQPKTSFTWPTFVIVKDGQEFRVHRAGNEQAHFFVGREEVTEWTLLTDAEAKAASVAKVA